MGGVAAMSLYQVLPGIANMCAMHFQTRRMRNSACYKSLFSYYLERHLQHFQTSPSHTRFGVVP